MNGARAVCDMLGKEMRRQFPGQIEEVAVRRSRCPGNGEPVVLLTVLTKSVRYAFFGVLCDFDKIDQEPLALWIDAIEQLTRIIREDSQ